MRTSLECGPIYSTLANDEDLAPLVEMFVDDLPDRVQLLLDQLQDSDLSGLRRTAHQMAGAAGSYGFPTLTARAANLEAAIADGESEQDVTALVNALVDLCRRARSGMPAGL